MKKVFLALTVASILTVAYGQTMTKKEAQQFLQKSWDYVKMKDSVSFSNLWSLNDSISKNHRRPHTTEETFGDYRAVREWLDTALTRNLKIDYVEVEQMNLKGTDTKYWIKAWFKYNDHYYKGYGFYIAYFNDKWVVRDNTTTSTFMQVKK